MGTNRYAHLAPVLLRLALGAVFTAHGLAKLMHRAATAAFFAKVGIPLPHAAGALVGWVESAGGILLLVGYGTTLIAVLLAIVMLVAIVAVKLPRGFVDGWELEFTLLMGALTLMLTGAGSLRATGGKQP